MFLKIAGRVDPREGYIRFGEEEAALIKDKPELREWGKTGVRALLKGLEEHLAIEFTDYAPYNYDSQVKSLSLASPLEKAFKDEIHNRFEDDLIDLRTGNKRRPADRRKDLKEKRAKANETARQDAPDRLLRLMENLNGLPSTRFKKRVNQSLGELRRRANLGGSFNQSNYAFNIFSAVKSQPVPLYQMTENTIRLSPFGWSILGFRTEWRQFVFEDCLEVDADSIQLALAASLWDLPCLHKMLSSTLGTENSWWQLLTEYLDDHFSSNRYRPEAHFSYVKGAAKSLTYAIVFGMSRRNLRRFGNPQEMTANERYQYKEQVDKLKRIYGADDIEEIGEMLLKHPAITELLTARQNQFSAIKEEGGVRDCFDRWIQYSSGKRTLPSVLSEVMQAAEVRAMLPVGEKALNDDRFNFYLWQHDGITVRPIKKAARRYRAMVQELSDALDQGLRALQKTYNCKPIPTSLSVDYGESLLT